MILVCGKYLQSIYEFWGYTYIFKEGTKWPIKIYLTWKIMTNTYKEWNVINFNIIDIFNKRS